MEYTHLAGRIINRPILMEPGRARVLVSALASRIGIQSMRCGAEILAGDQMLALADSFSRQTGRPDKPYTLDGGIAILSVDGTLVHKSGYLMPQSGVTGYDGLAGRIATAEADPDVHGILLDMDTPGGEVSGVDDLGAMILRSSKPIWAHANELACSAGYWIASQASRVIVSRTAHVGSVGVVLVHVDESEADKAAGLLVTLVYSGDHKVDGNPYEGLPDAVREKWQQDLDTIRQMFAARVAKARGMKLSVVLSTEGGVYMGADAVSAGLADEVASFSDTVSKMKRQFGGAGNRAGGVDMANGLVDNMISGPDADAGSQCTNKARSEGFISGVKSERERIGCILMSAEAKGREGSALKIAINTDLNSDQADQILSSIPLASTNTIASRVLSQMGAVQELGAAPTMISAGIEGQNTLLLSLSEIEKIRKGGL